MNIIELDSVDIEFTPFSFSYGFDLEPLINSIKEVGIINPPILKREKDKFIIVTGYKRILALKKLGQKRVEGRILEEDSSLRCLLISLHDNVYTRQLNEVEKAILISKLSHYISPEDVIKTYLPLLGLPKRRDTYELYLWISKLEDETKILIASGRMSIKAAHLMWEWELSEEDIGIYTKLMEKLKFSFNEQIQLIEYTQDICRKGNISLAYLIKEVEEIIENKNLTNHDKVKKIISILRRKNFPMLCEAEDLMNKKICELRLPEDIRIKVPLYFEEPYKIEISFKEGKELRQKLFKLLDKKLEQIKAPWKESTTPN